MQLDPRSDMLPASFDPAAQAASAASAPGSVQSAASNPFVSTFQTGRHYRVHKSYIWVAPIVAVAAALVVTLLNGMQGWVQLFLAVQSGEIEVNPLVAIGVVLLGIAVVAGVFVGLYALAWRNMSYVFDVREFSYYSGIITKRRVHVPYSRVQSVNHRASIVQRIVGVCTVNIDSAGGSSNKGVRVPYLRLETAERMRAELFMRKAAVEAGVEDRVVYAPVDVAASPTPVGAIPSRSAQTGRMHAAHQPGRDASSTAGEPELAATDSSRYVYGAAPLPPNGWSCPQCGKVGTGNFCADCGTPRPVAPAHPNVLDAAAGAVGDWRGLYGGSASFGEEPVSYELGLSNRELALTAVSHDTPLVAALVVFLAFVVTLAFALLADDAVAFALAAIALPIVVISTVATWAFGLFTVLVSYGRFRARRRGSRIEVERGLLAREFSGIDIDRVQSVEVRQSVIRRLIGYCELSLGRIDTAGEQSSSNSSAKSNAKGLVIHPFVRVDRVDEIIDGLAPELKDRPRRADCAPLPKPALRRALLRRCVWYNAVLWIAVAVGACWALLGVAVDDGFISFSSVAMHARYETFMTGSLVLVIAVCAAITVGRGVGAVLWARHSGFAWNHSYLLVHNDGLFSSTTIIPRRKIQSASTRSNPFQRRLSLATLQAVTAAGTRSTTVRLIDVTADQAENYLDWLKPRR